MLRDCDRWLCMAVYRQDPAGQARLYCVKQHDRVSRCVPFVFETRPSCVQDFSIQRRKLFLYLCRSRSHFLWTKLAFRIVSIWIVQHVCPMQSPQISQPLSFTCPLVGSTKGRQWTGGCEKHGLWNSQCCLGTQQVREALDRIYVHSLDGI